MKNGTIHFHEIHRTPIPKHLIPQVTRETPGHIWSIHVKAWSHHHSYHHSSEVPTFRKYPIATYLRLLKLAIPSRQSKSIKWFSPSQHVGDIYERIMAHIPSCVVIFSYLEQQTSNLLINNHQPSLAVANHEQQLTIICHYDSFSLSMIKF